MFWLTSPDQFQHEFRRDLVPDVYAASRVEQTACGAVKAGFPLKSGSRPREAATRSSLSRIVTSALADSAIKQVSPCPRRPLGGRCPAG